MVVLSSFFLVACGTEPPAIRFDEVTIAEEKANHIEVRPKSWTCF